VTMTKSSVEEELWNRWIQANDRDAANELIKKYTYLVMFHVERIATHLPSNVHKDDLISLAYMGLFDAIKRFEPNRDLKFDTYASFRIRGSIIDGLRKEDWLPRSLREKAKQVEAASEELEQAYQREPSTAEIAEKLNITSSEVETIIKDSLFAHVLSIEQKTKNDNEDYKEGIGYIIPDEEMKTPDEYMLQVELKEELADVIKSLNKNEQLVISLFYDDELTMTEIGEVLGLTTSRISQIHKQALYKMKRSLEKLYMS